ncbi:ribulokinase [Roseiconus nitratireducens]|uniref:Ribulokinase n=1 Tax=Roseiconus nitratireducens TaxID=2605748 RepID=A0A5M6DEI7_9BACT|nr:ribulokinase [Roseiconus nitratireducens]KAA5545937.1 ribulokinase [Roseiconus nitratireducens]
MTPVSLGLDFGTESVRAVLIDAGGAELGVGTSAYRHGQITKTLPQGGDPLPAEYALQHPEDWIESAAQATRHALSQAKIKADAVVGIGVDFTSCTMLPTKSDGTPLCLLESFQGVPLAWPKLWKHHGALSQTERMNELARQRGESFLDRYGGIIGLEWFFPKMLETIELSPEVAAAAEVWLEAGDWFVWRLVGCEAEVLPRSTCQAGYKALWSAEDGYASEAYLDAVHPELGRAARTKMPGRLLSPGETAGTLTAEMADRFGLTPGIAVSAATIDAHAAVPGVGAAEPGTLVMVLGTSSCHMLNSGSGHPVPGVAGIVRGGILPGMYGYETGQAAVGDAFAWLLRLLNLKSFHELTDRAMSLPPGADGVMCLDWMNGCRTPLMDGSLRGAFTGLTLAHDGAHLYRALLEASGFGLRWIVDVLRDGGVAVDRFVATGGLPHHNPAVVQVYADVLGETIEIHPSEQGPAVGAAVLGMVAAGAQRSGFADVTEASTAMAAIPHEHRQFVFPNPDHQTQYDGLYRQYRVLADVMSQGRS